MKLAIAAGILAGAIFAGWLLLESVGVRKPESSDISSDIPADSSADSLIRAWSDSVAADTSLVPW